MNFKSEQVLTKTPQGVNATRGGVGLSLKAHTMLKLFDGTMPVSGFKDICRGASMSETDFQSTLTELVQIDHLRIVADNAADAQPRVSSDAERRMLLTLDFTAASEALARRTDKPVAATASAASSARPVKAPPLAPQVATQTEATPEDRTARLRRETEVRQKLMAALQPHIEDELRTRLRPKLEQELRPKLIAALRPGLEAEVRTALIQELTPRVELELKARFAKTLAAQRAADQQTAPAEPAMTAPVVTAPIAIDSGAERLLASMIAPLFSLDKTGVCSYMSPAWAQFTGYATHDVVGKSLVDFFADTDRHAMTALLAGVANGTALRFEQQGTLVRHGNVPLWAEISAAPLSAANGELIGVCGMIRDATELRRTVDQAEADGVRLLLLVEQIDSGVILEDADGNIQQANPALCTLLSLDAAPFSLEGMVVTELFERASGGFIGPEGFLRRVSEIRTAGEDSKGESFVMADGRVIEQDYLTVTVGTATVGHVWLFREMQRPRARPVP